MSGDEPSAIVPIPPNAPVVVVKTNTYGNGGREAFWIYK